MGAVELDFQDAKLSCTQDVFQLPGCFSESLSCVRNQSIRMETEARRGSVLVFETFSALEKWLKSKCNKLWPSCPYCGRRYAADEVTCAGCGGPRGEK